MVGVGDDELKTRACYRLNDGKHRDKTGRFLESKNVGFDNPVYAFLKEPKLTDFVIQRHDGKKEKSQHCETWDVEDHRVPIERLCKRYGTHPDRGLTEEQAKKNQEKYGKNRVEPLTKRSEFIKFWKNVLFGLNLLLWLCGTVSIITYVVESTTTDKTDPGYLNSGIALLLVVLVSGGFTYYQEFESNRIIESFRKLDSHTAVVWRDARRKVVDASDLVVGDIIEVKYGERIPADIRIIESQGLKVDNCLLTGESQPQNRRPTFTDRNPLETKNLIFFSTTAIAGTFTAALNWRRRSMIFYCLCSVVIFIGNIPRLIFAGSAKGVVIRVGEQTYMGRLAQHANSLDTSETPLALEMHRIIGIMTSGSILFGLIFFMVALSMNYSLIDSVFFVVGIVVANVPENLSITLTIQLALIAKKMAKKNCYVKHLHAVESLGSASVICTGQTGTLTQNKMSVAHMWFNDSIAEADRSEFAKTGFVYDINDAGYNSLMKVASLCSRAKFKPCQDDVPFLLREVEGDGSEAGILKYIESQLGNCMQYRDKHPKVCEIPFNSTTKFQVSVHDMKDPKDLRYLLVMKGAPESIVPYCTTILIDNVEYELDDFWKKRIYEVSIKLGKLGERVLGFCDRRLNISKFPQYHLFDSEKPDFLNEGLRFVGLISLIDPPRAAVPAAIAKCKTAGIQVVMITGEHPMTATAIAQAVGIISEDLPRKSITETTLNVNAMGNSVLPSKSKGTVILGSELSRMTPEELDNALSIHKNVVFARTSPEQKYLIVESFKRLGHVVAVTGDKVQDAPALKRADIGIAMGISGAGVTKEVADIILMDDNFASIVAGVQDGRLLFDNLKKLIRFTLADNIAEMYCYWIFIIFKIPLPVGTLAMIISTMCIDVLPAISLAHESPACDLMKLMPRNLYRDTLVSPYTLSYSYGQISIMEVCAAFCSYFVTMAYNGFLPQRLLYIQHKWDNKAINDLQDSYGQEWSYHGRHELLCAAQTAFLIGLTVSQWANAIACKTRRLSIFQKGMQNPLMNVALVVSPAIACFLIYTPYVNTALNFRPVSFGPWAAAMPFALLIFIYDELRRLAVRRFQGGWVTSEFYR